MPGAKPQVTSARTAGLQSCCALHSTVGYLQTPKPWLKRHSETLRVTITTTTILIIIIKYLLYFITEVSHINLQRNYFESTKCLPMHLLFLGWKKLPFIREILYS